MARKSTTDVWADRAASKPMPARPEALGLDLLLLAQGEALSQLIDSDWFRSAPAEFRKTAPEIIFTGIEHHPVFASIGMLAAGSRSAPFLCGHTVVGGITTNVRLRLDFGGGGLVVDEIAYHLPI